MTSVHADVGEVLIDQDVLRTRVEELGAWAPWAGLALLGMAIVLFAGPAKGMVLVVDSDSAQSEQIAHAIGDSLFPEIGNGGYDAQHYALDLSYDIAG